MREILKQLSEGLITKEEARNKFLLWLNSMMLGEDYSPELLDEILESAAFNLNS